MKGQLKVYLFAQNLKPDGQILAYPTYQPPRIVLSAQPPWLCL